MAQHAALEPFGQLFVKQALHSKQTHSFQAFLTPECAASRVDASKQLFQFLQTQSLEERRVAFLNTIAKDQCRLAMKNRELYNRYLEEERDETDGVMATKAR